MKKRILVKVGSNVLGRENGRLNYNFISDLVDQIVELRKQCQVVLVSSGAQKAGREFGDFLEIQDPLIRKQMLASIGQGRLLQVYSEFFREQSVIIAQALITFTSFRLNISFQNVRNTLENLLNNDILPIINENDVVSYQESTFGDNDQLAALTAAMLNVDLMVLLSDITGFYTSDPKKNPDARLIPKVDEISDSLLSLCEDSLSDGGTGGMLSKLKAAQLASDHGIPAIVCYGGEKNCLLKAAEGKTSGTYFSPSKQKTKLSVRGKWMTTCADVKGTIRIDDGAKEALLNNKSLLAVGVTKLEGTFKKRDVVLIQDENNIRIGAGLANYDSAEAKKMAEIKSKGAVIIHKNHLYTL